MGPTICMQPSRRIFLGMTHVFVGKIPTCKNASKYFELFFCLYLCCFHFHVLIFYWFISFIFCFESICFFYFPYGFIFSCTFWLVCGFVFSVFTFYFVLFSLWFIDLFSYSFHLLIFYLFIAFFFWYIRLLYLYLFSYSCWFTLYFFHGPLNGWVSQFQSAWFYGTAYLKLGVLPWRAAQAAFATEPGGTFGLDAMFVAKWAKLGSMVSKWVITWVVPPSRMPVTTRMTLYF